MGWAEALFFLGITYLIVFGTVLVMILVAWFIHWCFGSPTRPVTQQEWDEWRAYSVRTMRERHRKAVGLRVIDGGRD